MKVRSDLIESGTATHESWTAPRKLFANQQLAKPCSYRKSLYAEIDGGSRAIKSVVEVGRNYALIVDERVWPTNVVSMYLDDDRRAPLSAAFGKYADAMIRVQYAAGAEERISVSEVADDDARSHAPAHRSAWRSFLNGLSNTFGIAPIRRPVESVEDSLRGTSDEVARAIEDVKARGRA